MILILKAGLLYFILVFGAGFILGPIRITWVEPRIGTLWAELLEMPVMLAVIIFSACWIIGQTALPDTIAARLGMGGLAVALLLAAEFGLVLRFRKMTIRDYLATRDPVSGTAYYLMLGLFALMPLFIRHG